MSEIDKHTNRIPFESLKGDEKVTSWKIPTVSDGGGSVKSAAREALEKVKAKKLRAQQQAQETIETLAATKKPKPMTAEELSRISEDARKEGYDIGYKEGLEKGEKDGFTQGQKSGETKAYTQTLQQRENEIARIKSIATELMEPMLGQQQQLENVIVEMAVEMAKQILMHELQQSPSALYKIVNHALSALPVGAANISVFLHPSDVALLTEVMPGLSSSWNIVGDSMLTPGGCRISTDESLVDFTVESRISAFLKEVRERGEVDENTLPDVEEFRADDNAEGSENIVSNKTLPGDDIIPRDTAPRDTKVKHVAKTEDSLTSSSVSEDVEREDD